MAKLRRFRHIAYHVIKNNKLVAELRQHLNGHTMAGWRLIIWNPDVAIIKQYEVNKEDAGIADLRSMYPFETIYRTSHLLAQVPPKVIHNKTGHQSYQDWSKPKE